MAQQEGLGSVHGIACQHGPHGPLRTVHNDGVIQSTKHLRKIGAKGEQFERHAVQPDTKRKNYSEAAQKYRKKAAEHRVKNMNYDTAAVCLYVCEYIAGSHAGRDISRIGVDLLGASRKGKPHIQKKHNKKLERGRRQEKMSQELQSTLERTFSRSSSGLFVYCSQQATI